MKLLSELVVEIKKKSQNNNAQNFLAAAILIIRKKEVSPYLLMSYFDWTKGYTNDVLTFLENKRVIGPYRWFRGRNILAKEEDLYSLLSIDAEEKKHKTEENHGWIKKAYIEIQSMAKNSAKNYDTFNLNPERAMQFHIGDKWVIDYERLHKSDFWIGTIEKYHCQQFSQNKERYFSSSSSLCFIQITERLFYENCLELHGIVISSDGNFYTEIPKE